MTSPDPAPPLQTSPSPSPADAAVAAPFVPADGTRFFGLDALRGTAMLLGVLYHALLFGGGMMMGPRNEGGLAPAVMNWIHSFRMPLFFLISGFFCHMMLGKYGVLRYLVRRWTRIGIPFLMALFTLAAIRTWGPQNNSPFGPPRGNGGPPFGPNGFRGPGGGGGGAQGGPGSGAFPGGPGSREGAPAPTDTGRPERPPQEFGGEMPPPPPGFVPPFLERFDKDHDGSLSAEEWKEAQSAMREMFRGGPGGPGGPGGGPPRGFPGFGGGHPIADRLFGTAAGNFGMAHLWFLWDLLVFATAAIPVSWIFGKLFRRLEQSVDDGLGRVIRWGFGPLSLALLSLGGLYLSGTSPGQPPSGFKTIMGVFPDVFLQWDGDWPYFFTYFMWGWLLFRLRAVLPGLGRVWLPTLVVGFGAYYCLKFLPQSGPFGGNPNALTGIAKLGGFVLFAVAASHMGLGLLAFFQRYLDRPNPFTRYLADTAFWIYLVHQDLIQGPVLSWVRPLKLQPMPQALLVVAVTTGIALVSFELIIRRTPLTTLFGPPRVRKPKPST